VVVLVEFGFPMHICQVLDDHLDFFFLGMQNQRWNEPSSVVIRKMDTPRSNPEAGNCSTKNATKPTLATVFAHHHANCARILMQSKL
jgi:hypothetical protein